MIISLFLVKVKISSLLIHKNQNNISLVKGWKTETPLVKADEHKSKLRAKKYDKF